MAFHILSISGGGYRGLFAAEVLALIEQRAGRQLWECFDLIAGTSIGGIIALGLVMGVPAEKIRSQFEKSGPTIFPERPTGLRGMWQQAQRPKFDGIALRETIESIVGAGRLLGSAKTRVLVPAVNVTSGKVQMFKTPHHPTLTEDQHLRAADIGMATSAAPLYFPLAKIKNSYFADGGLAANSPDICAVHEAIHFAEQDLSDLRVLSIGTTSSKFGIPTSVGADLGGIGWFTNFRLINTVFGVQQGLIESMMLHDLRENYLRIDEIPSGEHATELQLDVATSSTTETLKSLAETAYRRVSGQPLMHEFCAHHAPEPEFVKRRSGAQA